MRGQAVPSAPAPAVEWQVIDGVGERPACPACTLHTWNSDSPPTYTTTPLSVPDAILPAETSVDWFNGITVVRDGLGEPYGYAVAGYTFLPDVSFGSLDCIASPIGTYPEPLAFEHFDRRKGAQCCLVAMYDLQGNRLWSHAYQRGQLNAIIQDTNGDIVVAGETYDREGWIGSPWTTGPIYVDPTSGGQTSATAMNCAANLSQLFVMKIEPATGNAEWKHIFPSNGDLALARNERSQAFGIVETDPAGASGYRVVGFRRALTGTVVRDRPFMVDLNDQGFLNWKKVFNAGDGPILFPDADSDARAHWIARHPDPTREEYIITGVRRDADHGSSPSAFIMYFDQSSALTPLWMDDTNINAAEYATTASGNENAMRGCFAIDGTTTSIAWPVLTHFNGSIFPGNHEASGRVYKMDLTSTQIWPAPVDLGRMRGFDLLLDAVQLANGNLAVASTKSVVTTADPLTFAELAPAVQQCLAGFDPDPTVSDGVFDYDPNGQPGMAPEPYNWAAVPSSTLGYWLSDSYVAEVTLGSGGIAWEKVIDADDEGGNGTSTDCWPGNFRKRQCSFKVAEANPGELAICGNTGHGVEDGYIAKLRACDQFATYAPYMLDPEGEYHFTAPITYWSTSMNVKGSFVIDDGKTLEINNGAVIGFADSRQIGYTTNIVVKPGGKLRVIQGAKLTALDACPYSMWDGVLNLGNTLLVQSPAQQGTVEITDGTIAHAFVGVMGGEPADLMDPVFSTCAARGGRLIAKDATFRNNRFDVVLREYNSQYAYDYTVTKFIHCDFVFDETQLRYGHADRTAHVVARGYPRLKFHACDFSDDAPQLADLPAEWAEGILALNTSIQVKPMCNGSVSSPYNGICPNTANWTPSTFSGLSCGVNTQGFAADKSAFVDFATFSGNARGVLLNGVDHARVIRNTFNVPDLDVSTLGITTAYGFYLNGGTAFEVEENKAFGPGALADNPAVGLIFNNTGIGPNEYFNNYPIDGFANGAGVSAGVVIMGQNEGPGLDDGIHFRCNDHSQSVPNDFDMALTGAPVNVGETQGVDLGEEFLAGNTFANDGCDPATSERHIQVELGDASGLNQFTYWHHQISTVLQLVPECHTVLSLNDPVLMPGSYQYTSKAVACSTMIAPIQPDEDHMDLVINSEAELATLEDVYEDWADGGDTEGLIEFIEDPAHDSYAVRNQLMLVAPKVTEDAWRSAFEKQPPMNPWHLAQALIANSPLQPEVIDMMTTYGMDPYYRQLVEGQQGGGISMLSIMESELAWFGLRKATGLNDLTASALHDSIPDKLDTARVWQQLHPQSSSSRATCGLDLALGDLSDARIIVDAMLLGGTDPEYWEVADHLLDLLTAAQGPENVTPATLAELRTLASTATIGAAQAAAWLAFMNEPQIEPIILPRSWKSLSHSSGASATAASLITASPNPSDGMVYIVVDLPEGVERSIIQVIDPLGRTVREIQVTGRMPIVELDGNDLQAGLYLATLHCDGILAGKVKFELIR